MLFDQNFSRRFVSRPSDLYPDSIQVNTLGFARALDKEMWDYACQYNLTIDVDFNQMSLLFGRGFYK